MRGRGVYVCELGNMSCQRVMSLQLPHIAKDTPHVMPFPPSGREWARAVKNAVVSAQNGSEGGSDRGQSKAMDLASFESGSLEELCRRIPTA